MTSAPDSGRSFGSIMARGTALMVAMRWGMRLAGLVSTLVLARLLVPEDFGIVAMAATLMALLDSVLNFGVHNALIQDREAGRAEYDTAWTIRIGQAAFVAAILLAASPLAVDFYDEPRVQPVMWAMAGIAILRGLENIGVVDFRRDLRFGLELIFHLLGKIVQVALGIALAVVLRDYWALVLGILGGAVAKLLLSFVMSPYRPRLSLSAFRSIWSFSQWMLLFNLSQVMGERGDRILLGGYAPAGIVGNYSVAMDLARMPTMELRAPIERTIAPGFAHIKSDAERTNDAALKGLGLMAIAVFPAVFGVSAVARDFVLVLLGQKWAAAIPFVEAGAVEATFFALLGIPHMLLLMTGHVRRTAVVMTVWGLAVLGLAYPAFIVVGVAGFAGLKAGATLLALAAMIWQMSAVRHIPIREILAQLWRPALASVVMAGTIRLLNGELELGPFAALPVSVLTGIAVYALVLLPLWVVSGRPAGAESLVMGFVRHKFSRIGL